VSCNLIMVYLCFYMRRSLEYNFRIAINSEHQNRGVSLAIFSHLLENSTQAQDSVSGFNEDS
jgi:hypothetical protein